MTALLLDACFSSRVWAAIPALIAGLAFGYLAGRFTRKAK